LHDPAVPLGARIMHQSWPPYHSTLRLQCTHFTSSRNVTNRTLARGRQHVIWHHLPGWARPNIKNPCTQIDRQAPCSDFARSTVWRQSDNACEGKATCGELCPGPQEIRSSIPQLTDFNKPGLLLRQLVRHHIRIQHRTLPSPMLHGP
jgi:hypothetical protein